MHVYEHLSKKYTGNSLYIYLSSVPFLTTTYWISYGAVTPGFPLWLIRLPSFIKTYNLNIVYSIIKFTLQKTTKTVRCSYRSDIWEEKHPIHPNCQKCPKTAFSTIFIIGLICDYVSFNSMVIIGIVICVPCTLKTVGHLTSQFSIDMYTRISENIKGYQHIQKSNYQNIFQKTSSNPSCVRLTDK